MTTPSIHNNNNNKRSNCRKRCRPVARRLGLAAVAAAAAAMCCAVPTTTAFVNPPLPSTTRFAPSHAAAVSSSPLATTVMMAATSTTTKSKSKNNNHNHYRTSELSSAPPRLSADEQRDLLLQAIESRRIKQLESELAMPKKTVPLLSIRCKNAGYGEDWEAYETALARGEVARETLITTNMGLVHYCVNEIIGTKAASRKRLNSLSREDLIQEGSIGLARAIDRWNPAIGGKFSTYAVYWVRAAILRCIAEKDDLLRIPEHMSTTVRKMTRGAHKLGLELDSDEILSSALWKEAKAAKALAEEAGLTDKQLTEAMRIRARRNTGGYVEFESWMQKGVDIESDVSTVTSRDEHSLRGVEVEDLRKALGRYLRPKEMEALFWRYGLLDESTTTTTTAPTTTTTTTAKKQPENYLARAEKELYGTVTTKTKSKPTQSSIPVKGKWGEAMSFTEVGKKMEVSAEYGRRLCHAALKKLRQAADDGLLEPALLY